MRQTHLLRGISLIAVVGFFFGAELASQETDKTVGAAKDFLSVQVNGISSFKAEKGVLYTALLYRTKPNVFSEDCALAVLETADARSKMILRIADRECNWRQVVAYAGNRFSGFLIYAGHPDTWFGPVTVVGVVDGQAKVLHEGTLPAEVVDLDNDNIPEVFESRWPSGDGYPKTTNVYAWDGRVYKLLTSVPWADRFSRRVSRLVSRHSKAVRAKVNAN